MRRRAFSLITWIGASLILIASSSCGEVVRIPLFHDDNNDINALVRIGNGTFVVAVDSGSSDSWVAVDEDYGEAMFTSRDNTALGFTLAYGGGHVSGSVVLEAICLLASHPHDEIVLPPIPIGVVSKDSVRDNIRANGVIGLGMEGLQQLAVFQTSHHGKDRAGSSLLISRIAQNSTTKQSNSTLDATFSIYIDPLAQNGSPSRSLLTFGGIDPDFGAQGEEWHSFPVVQSEKGYGFWAIRMCGARLGEQELGGSNGDGATNLAIAIVDSGSSLILLPPHAFRNVLHALTKTLGSRLSCIPRDQLGFTSFECICQRCAPSDFPDLLLRFGRDADTCTPRHLGTLGNQLVVLNGSDYTQCRFRECLLLIDTDTAIDPDHIILGAVFLRAYYTAFNYSSKEVSLVRAPSSMILSVRTGTGGSMAWRTVMLTIVVAGFSMSSIVLLERRTQPLQSKRES